MSDQPTSGTTDNTVTTITGITGVSLTAGTWYFLYITAGAADTFDAWNFNSTGATGTEETFCNLGSCPFTQSRSLGAFDVVGGVTATPLPTALPLFVSGLGGIGLLGWRRKRKAQALIA